MSNGENIPSLESKEAAPQTTNTDSSVQNFYNIRIHQRQCQFKERAISFANKNRGKSHNSPAKRNNTSLERLIKSMKATYRLKRFKGDKSDEFMKKLSEDNDINNDQIL